MIRWSYNNEIAMEDQYTKVWVKLSFQKNLENPRAGWGINAAISTRFKGWRHFRIIALHKARNVALPSNVVRKSEVDGNEPCGIWDR